MSLALVPQSQTNSPSKQPSKGPLPTHCSCELPAASRVSHSGNNPGRAYLNCVNRPYKSDATTQRGCKFFAWVDEYDPPMPQEQSSQTSTASTTSVKDTPSSRRATIWSGDTPLKRRRSASPTPTKASTAVDSSAIAGPPSTLYASTSTRPLYSSPSPAKKIKTTHTTSEEELWGDFRDNDDETQETIGSVRPRDSISQVLSREESNKESAPVPEPSTSRAAEATPARNTNTRFGLITPVSSSKSISRLYSSPRQQDDTNDSNKEAPLSLRTGPILVADPDNPFVVDTTQKGKEPETPQRILTKKPSIPDTPKTPSGLIRQDSASLVHDLRNKVAETARLLEMYERQVSAVKMSLEHRDNRIKRLTEEVQMLKDANERLKEENGRLKARSAYEEGTRDFGA